MRRVARRVSAGLAGLMLVALAGLWALPASAHGETSAAPASCGYWNPANNFRVSTNLTAYHVAIFSANNAQSCVLAYSNSDYEDPVYIFCEWTNPANHNQHWFYLYDELVLQKGWVAGSNVDAGSVGAC